MEKKCVGAGLFPLYAFRLKQVRGDSWRLFTLDVDDSSLIGRLKYIFNKVPIADKSRDGYYILRWDQGIPLNEFISYISRFTSK
jgi:hypothetical protein